MAKKSKLCVAQAGKILPVVAEKLGLDLPPVRFAKPQAGELPEYDKDVKLRCTLAQLGEVSVELVARSDLKLQQYGWCNPGICVFCMSLCCRCSTRKSNAKYR